MKKNLSCISLNYRKVAGASAPVLVIDFCNENNERYTLRYNLPPDTPERTERRVSLLLYLLRKHSPQRSTTWLIDQSVNEKPGFASRAFCCAWSIKRGTSRRGTVTREGEAVQRGTSGEPIDMEGK